MREGDEKDDLPVTDVTVADDALLRMTARDVASTGLDPSADPALDALSGLLSTVRRQTYDDPQVSPLWPYRKAIVQLWRRLPKRTRTADLLRALKADKDFSSHVDVSHLEPYAVGRWLAEVSEIVDAELSERATAVVAARAERAKPTKSAAGRKTSKGADSAPVKLPEESPLSSPPIPSTKRKYLGDENTGHAVGKRAGETDDAYASRLYQIYLSDTERAMADQETDRKGWIRRVTGLAHDRHEIEMRDRGIAANDAMLASTVDRMEQALRGKN